MRLKTTFLGFTFGLSLLFAAVFLFGSAPPATNYLPDLVDKVMPAVVNVSSVSIVRYRQQGMDQFLRFWGIPQERSHTSLGSGVIIDNDGFVLTNYHVVAEADELNLTLFDKRQVRARLVGKDQKMDIALLQIRNTEGAFKGLPPGVTPAPLGNSEAVRIAESVFAVGNPFGFQHTVTTGIISAKNRTVGQGPFDNFLQTDASINPGNSGGPLFNFKGEVIGINTLIISRTEQSAGVGFAIPINSARELVSDLKKFGRVPRPWIGIQGERMTPQHQAYYGLGTDKGILVYGVVARGPADRAKITRGDILLAVDDQIVLEQYDVERVLAKLKAGQTINLKVLRGQKQLNLKTNLQELPKLDNLPDGIM